MKRYIMFIFFIFVSFYSLSETLEIRCDRPELVYNDHVGNEWVFDFKIEGQSYPMNEKIQLEVSDRITFVFAVQEIDKISDFGSSTLTIDLNTLDFDNELYTDIKVIVFENRGRYSGNSAQWKFRIYYTKLEKSETEH